MNKVRAIICLMILIVSLISVSEGISLFIQHNSNEVIDDWLFNIEEAKQEVLGYSSSDPVTITIYLLITIWLLIELCLKMLYLPKRTNILISVLIFSILLLLNFSEKLPQQALNKQQQNLINSQRPRKSFREEIKQGFIINPTEFSFKNLFRDYKFSLQTKPLVSKTQTKGAEFLTPTYSWAKTTNPFSKIDEYFLAVNLFSSPDLNSFKRKKLNLAIALDISKNMSQMQTAQSKNKINKTKLELAQRSINNIIGMLSPQDRLGMLLFNQEVFFAKPMRKIERTQLKATKEHINNIEAFGNLNNQLSLEAGIEMVSEFALLDPEEYENRLIFMTSQRFTNTQKLIELTELAHKKGVNITFLCIGNSFKRNQISKLQQIRGCNYLSLFSENDFITKLESEFNHLVTPMAYDLVAKLKSNAFKIEKIYGITNTNLENQEILRLATFFPKKTTMSGSRGGLILIKLKKLSESDELDLSISFKDRRNKTQSLFGKIPFKNSYANLSQKPELRKAILLARYGELVKAWLTEEEEMLSRIGDRNIYRKHSEFWRKISGKQNKSKNWKELISYFNKWFYNEMTLVKDNSLIKELNTLKMISIRSLNS